MLTIHTTVSRLVSNLTSLEFYDYVVNEVRDYHSTVLKDIEINSRK